jgi:ABC-type sugar transport system substrate-binding protein
VEQPDQAFNGVISSAFANSLKQMCPKCTVTPIPIPDSAIGTTAPQKIVSVLQANPKLSVLSAAAGEGLNGLTPALRQAGVQVKVVSTTGDPENLADLKAGAEQANVESDIPVLVWTALDAALRAAQHQPFAPGEIAGLPVMQILQPADVTFNPEHGWTGYPDFAARFAKLWHT